MTLEGRFVGYDPTPSYFYSTTFKIKIINTCSKAIITPNTNTTFYHVINTGPMILPITPLWTDSYIGACGPIIYDTSTASLPSFLTFTSPSGIINLNSILSSDA